MGKLLLDVRMDMLEHMESDTGDVVISQEIQPILDKIHNEQVSSKSPKQFTRNGQTFTKIAEWPMVLVESLKAQGIDVIKDPEARDRILNSSEFSAFRLQRGTV